MVNKEMGNGKIDQIEEEGIMGHKMKEVEVFLSLSMISLMLFPCQ